MMQVLAHRRLAAAVQLAGPMALPAVTAPGVSLGRGQKPALGSAHLTTVAATTPAGCCATAQLHYYLTTVAQEGAANPRAMCYEFVTSQASSAE
eukprot:COSAG01_NODE_17094_length_1179_cov_1.250000_1_plen_94_part_00